MSSSRLNRRKLLLVRKIGRWEVRMGTRIGRVKLKDNKKDRQIRIQMVTIKKMGKKI